MKWLGSILAVCAVAIAVMVLMGLRVPREHHVAGSAVIDAPQLAVWTAISDVRSAPQWRPEVKLVELLDDNRWKESGSHGSMTFRLGHAEPMSRRIVVFDDRNAPFTGKWTFTLEPVENGKTQVTIAEDATVFSPVWRFVGHYVIGERSSIDEYLRDLEKSFAFKKSG